MEHRQSTGRSARRGPTSAALPRILAAGLMGGLAALSGCSSGGNTQPSREAPRAVPVTIGAAVQTSVPLRIRAIGAAEAYSTVAVKTMVSGELTKVAFTEGQDVRKGDLLFEIDRRPLEASLKEAEATLAKEVALRENAEKEAARFASLVEKDLVPRQQYDQTVSNAAALAAAVDADKARVENIRVQLGYCTIRSPIDGRTGSLVVHRGNVVKANDSTLVVINQVTPIHVAFAVPEQYLAEVRKRRAAGPMAVLASPPGEEKEPARGTLAFIGNQVDNATGTIGLKAIFPNADRRLWPGQFLNVTLTLSVRPDAVVVPAQAIQTGQQGQYVFVVKPDMTVEMRAVVAGQSADGETIVEKGVRAGEKVVTDGQLRLVPGTRVEVAGAAVAAPTDVRERPGG